MEPDSRDLGQCVAECASRGGDTKDKIIGSGHESGQEEQSDSESERATAVPRTSPRGGGGGGGGGGCHTLSGPPDCP